LGCSPGRWVIADGFILFFGMGVYFDSFSSQRATGLLRLKVVLAVLFGGGGRRRGRRASVVREGSRDSDVILLFLRVLCEVRLAQLSPYPIRTCLCICLQYCTFFLLEIQIRIIKKSIHLPPERPDTAENPPETGLALDVAVDGNDAANESNPSFCISASIV